MSGGGAWELNREPPRTALWSSGCGKVTRDARVQKTLADFAPCDPAIRRTFGAHPIGTENGRLLYPAQPGRRQPIGWAWRVPSAGPLGAAQKRAGRSQLSQV